MSQQQRILIVDDDDDVRESLRDELGANYQVEVIASGEEALRVISPGRFDAVVSDLRMPRMNGIQVLEYAHQVDPELVRILLTGYLDEDAQVATRHWNAPFKVGKPWHDQLDITLRRAFEARDRARELSRSVDDALSNGAVDDEFALAENIDGLARVLVRRLAAIGSVSYACVRLLGATQARVLELYDAGTPLERGDSWEFDDAVSADGAYRIKVCGSGAVTRAISAFLVERARRFASASAALLLGEGALTNPIARQQLLALSRRATIGVMTGSLMHELASLLQSLKCTLVETTTVGRDPAGDDSSNRAARDDARLVVQRMGDLFGAIRAFIYAGAPDQTRIEVSELVSRAITVCAHDMHELRIAVIPPVEVYVAEPLIVQVLVNLLRNAHEVSARGAFIDLGVTVDHGLVTITVVDDGPGVSAEQEAHLFQPLFTTKRAEGGSGLGLSFCAQVVRDAGGVLSYRRAAGRGACFEVHLPLAPDLG